MVHHSHQYKTFQMSISHCHPLLVLEPQWIQGHIKHIIIISSTMLHISFSVSSCDKRGLYGRGDKALGSTSEFRCLSQLKVPCSSPVGGEVCCKQTSSQRWSHLWHACKKAVSGWSQVSLDPQNHNFAKQTSKQIMFTSPWDKDRLSFWSNSFLQNNCVFIYMYDYVHIYFWKIK